MGSDDLSVLWRRLDAAHGPGADVEIARCGLCDSRLEEATDAVEVAFHTDQDGPDAWLCASCYGYVVEDLNVAPVRVFKAGPRRSVVLPVSAEPEREAGE